GGGGGVGAELIGHERFGGGAVIAGELRAIAVAGAKTPGETALHWPSRRLVILGDAAVGRPRGALTLLPADKLPDVAAARAGVAQLAQLDVDVILVGDGDDVLARARDALAAFRDGPAPGVAAGGGGC